MFYRNIKYIGLLTVILVMIGAFWFFGSLIDMGKPDIAINQDITAIGRQKAIEVAFSDPGSGLRYTLITMSQGDKAYTLSSTQYPEKGTHAKTVSLTIDPLSMKMHDGPATFDVFDISIKHRCPPISKKVRNI
jgi:hypothetical protein